VAQIPKLLNKTTLTKTITNPQYGNQISGPTVGRVPPADIMGYEIKKGNYDLFYRGAKIGTVYELVNVGNNKYVIKDIAGYVVAMLLQAKKDKVDLRVTSGFRTMQEQLELYNKNKHSAAMTVSKPGFNRHQIGIAIEFNVYENRGDVYEWLVKNAWRYGFVRTTPSERWHWEYWGSFPEQVIPQWAKSKRLKHQPLSMYSIVPKYHNCGDGALGGQFKMLPAHWWTSYGARSGHTDETTEGQTNSWVGFDNEFLPEKLDKTDPHWDRRKF